jgi:hypothetical protein
MLFLYLKVHFTIYTCDRYWSVRDIKKFFKTLHYNKMEALHFAF